ncbi:MAG: hypothetical protein U1F43_17905 [Myxococcota bacterium]
MSDGDRALLDAILRGRARLELRIDNLLETARIDLEQRPYTAGAATIDLGALVRDVRDDALSLHRARRFLHAAAFPDEPLFVAGDLRALRPALREPGRQRAQVQRARLRA